MSWAGTGDAYAASYAQLCAGTGPHLRALTGDARDRSLLDVGAGDGTLASAWADAGWRVTACDPEPSMREMVRGQHPSLGVVDGALPHLPFGDGAFDVVAANFVLNHLDDPRAGAAELRRVARGCAVATAWSSAPTSLWSDVTRKAGLTPAASTRLPADKDFERTTPGFERMLRDAGWNPEISELAWNWHATPQALWSSVDGGVAGAGSFYRGLSDADRATFRVAFDALMAERAHGGTVALMHTAVIAVESLH